MNPFVADPEWGWWIVFYFYLGGIAAGSYFVATLIELIGGDDDRPLAAIGYRVAFPLIGVCGILLIVDLDRPERFWHMMFQSEDTWHAPLLKWWSPMSIGAWALALFGAWSFLSFVNSFWTAGFPARWLGRNVFGHVFRIVGSGIGFFVASYTGVLLNATNQPAWSVSDWIGPLFLTSATSTALAVMLLFGRGVSAETRERLERADLWALGLELFLFLIFLASLGGLLPLLLQTWQGWLLVVGTLMVGLLIPLALHFFLDRLGSTRATLAAVFALAGGFVLRFGVVNIAPVLLRSDDREFLDHVQTPLYSSSAGVGLLFVTLTLACAIPILVRRHWRLAALPTALACLVSVLVLAGVSYYSLQPLTERPPLFALRISPEDGRPRAGGVGASIFNRPEAVKLRTKIVKDGEP